MLIALRAKDKLGFVNGKCEMPNEDGTDLEKWLKADSMVMSWILNSISKNIAESFLYMSSIKELWDELAQKFGESNGPQLYQITRNISSLQQGNQSVMTYFTTDMLKALSACSCGALKDLTKIDEGDELV